MLKPIKLTGEQKNVLFLPPKNPIQIKGVAGSGKTTVALYRAKHLLETQTNLFQEAKIIIFTYYRTLANYINKISPYVTGGYQKGNDEMKPTSKVGLNVQITNFHRWAFSFIERNGFPLRKQIIKNGFIKTEWKTITSEEKLLLIERAKNKFSYNITTKSVEFFKEEISWIKGKLFTNKAEYLKAKRMGRGTTDRVTKKDKEHIWDVYREYQDLLKKLDKIDFDDYAIIALNLIENNQNFTPPYTHIIIDEAQDLNKAQILVISKLVSPETNSITIIADAAQRIYKSGFTWKEVGINVRGGRTIEFKKNYRNSVQIARAALSLLENEPDKSEFTKIEAALKGEEKPKIGLFNTEKEQYDFLLAELNKLKESNKLFSTVILHRRRFGVETIHKILKNNGFETEIINSNSNVNYENNTLKICTMSSIKGLEFNNVFIIDLNEGIFPHPEGFTDENDELHISTERRLLYTSMTRARKKLYLLSSGIPSRYIYEINKKYIDLITE